MNKRIRRIRKVLNPPIIKGFMPFGGSKNETEKSPVILLFEEYEAIRLCDYDMVNHHEASVIMGVSRPTFTRIFASARQKIAKAFVEGLPMTIEGGKVYFDSDWYHCNHCHCDFSNPHKMSDMQNCPLCGSADINHYEDDKEESNGCNDICICPSCAFEMKHQKGKPCISEDCPQCGNKMNRKRKNC